MILCNILPAVPGLIWGGGLFLSPPSLQTKYKQHMMVTLPAGFTMFKHTNRRGYIIVFNIKACRLLLSYLWRCGAAEEPSVGELHVLPWQPNSRGFFPFEKGSLEYASRLMSDRSYQNVSLCQPARV